MGGLSSAGISSSRQWRCSPSGCPKPQPKLFDKAPFHAPRAHPSPQVPSGQDAAGAVAHAPLQLVEGDQIQLQVDLVPFYQPQGRTISPEALPGPVLVAGGSQPKNTYFLTFHNAGRLHMGI